MGTLLGTVANKATSPPHNVYTVLGVSNSRLKFPLLIQGTGDYTGY